MLQCWLLYWAGNRWLTQKGWLEKVEWRGCLQRSSAGWRNRLLMVLTAEPETGAGQGVPSPAHSLRGQERAWLSKPKESSAVGVGRLAETGAEKGTDVSPGLAWRDPRQTFLSGHSQEFCGFPCLYPRKPPWSDPGQRAGWRGQRVDSQGKQRISFTPERCVRPDLCKRKSSRPSFSANLASAPSLPHYLLLCFLLVAPS